VGAGHITGIGLDCSRTAGGTLAGDCEERVVDRPDQCDELRDVPSAA
jgi:hypothetical protein